MINFFGGRRNSGEYPSADAGAGSLGQYAFNLIPVNKHVKVRLAGSDPVQDELARVQSTKADGLEAFIARRTAEEERTDAPVPVRFFVESRMSGIVGFVPRGLEAPVLEALSRLDGRSGSKRIPARIVSTRHGLRVELLMGFTR